MIFSGIKMPVSHSLYELEKAIAKKCGFKESYRQHYADVKFKLISL